MNAKQGLDSDCAVVHSFSDEEIKDGQYIDPDLSWFLKFLMNILRNHMPDFWQASHLK